MYFIMANCTTNTQFLQSSAESIFLVCFTSVQCVVGSVANAVVIGYFISRRKHSCKPSEKLTLNLALADFVALTTYTFLGELTFYTYDKGPSILRTILRFLSLVSFLLEMLCY